MPIRIPIHGRDVNYAVLVGNEKITSYILHIIIIKFIVLCGQIKGFVCSITTLLFEVGSYRTVVE